MNKKLRKIGEKYFGEDYLQFLLAAGVACDVDSVVLAKELETTIAAVEEMREKYKEELLSLKTHSGVVAEVYDSLSKIRLTNIAMKLQDSLLDDLVAGEVDVKTKAVLLQFLTKTLDSTTKVKPAEDVKSDAEYRERVQRLAEGTGLRVVK